jgi:hypothetical protein
MTLYSIEHMITFRGDGTMEVSAQFTKSLSNLNIDKNLKIDVSEGMKKYLRGNR